jgi:signal transduction histidine kinase
MKPEPSARGGVARYQLNRTTIAIISVAAYALVFVPAYAATGVIAASLSVIPIAVVGWLFGRRGGLLVGLLSIPLHIMLFTLVGAAGWQVVLEQWPGSVMGVVVGVLMGWLGEFVGQVQAQSAALVRERAALQAEIMHREIVERALQQSKTDAEAASRAKSNFLANMSHELRTPLTTIIGYCELISNLSERPGYDGLRSDLARIEAAGQHLLTLISDILDLSKIEAGRMDLYLEWFGLTAFGHEVAAAVRPLVARQGNSLCVEFADDLGSIYIDRTKVRQVLLNLLSNAAKFTAQGTITFAITREGTIEQEPGWVCFKVADTGIGISEDYLPRLFEPFTQADSTITQAHGGTGLGLALSQRFCLLMGGAITVASTLGGGSTFVARLPAVVADPPETDVASQALSDTSSVVNYAIPDKLSREEAS